MNLNVASEMCFSSQMFWLVDHAFLSVTGEGSRRTDGTGAAASFPPSQEHQLWETVFLWQQKMLCKPKGDMHMLKTKLESMLVWLPQNSIKLVPPHVPWSVLQSPQRGLGSCSLVPRDTFIDILLFLAHFIIVFPATGFQKALHSVDCPDWLCIWEI